MSIMQNMKIRHKLTAIIMLTCVTSLVIVGAVFVAWGYSSSRKSLVQSLSTHAEMIADSCKASVTFDDSDDAKDTLSTLNLEPSIVHASIYLKSGKELAGYNKKNSIVPDHPSRIMEDGYSFNDGFLSVFKSIVVDKETIASVCLISNLEPLRAALLRTVYVVISILLCVSLIAYLLSVKLQAIISAPILSLTKIARDVSRNKEYSVCGIKHGDDEIGVLVDSFNEMLADIQSHRSELVEINESLEVKVVERTSELTSEITERKQAEQALRENEERFRDIAENMSDWIWEVDTDGVYTHCSANVDRIIGYKNDEVLGKTPFDFMSSQEVERVSSIFGEIVREKKSFRDVENWNIAKDGQRVCLMTSGIPIHGENGEFMGYRGVDTDVTERKLAEQKLEIEKERAEAANVAKSQFLANMSHEIRTPMNGIMGFSDLLADEDLTETQKSYVDIICNSGKNLLTLIDDILDFSKIEAGQLKTEKVECSLGDILNSVGSLMRPKVIEKGIEFKIVEVTSLPAKIYSDPTRLQQCLINLIGNAIKFTEEGHVHVNVSMEDIGDQSHIRFDVEDTGIGIEKDKQAKVFESFTQADGDTTRKYGGTGLGLTITRQLTELMGGQLCLASEAGVGTTFTLMIPAGINIEDQPLLDRYNRAGHNDFANTKTEYPEFSANVLVAEDDPTNQMLIKLLLEHMGLQVTIAEDGKKAMEKVLAGQFDLIFMDMQMPCMNGYEAAKLLREKGITKPIIALTANAMKGDKKKCLESGCDGYLSKPIVHDQLVKILEKYLPAMTAASGK